MYLWPFSKNVQAMKRITVFAASLFLFPVLASAQQQTGDQDSDSLEYKSVFETRSRILTFDRLDQRKIYNWATGQRATPSGRQAGERNLSPYVRVYGDSAIVVPDPYKKGI